MSTTRREFIRVSAMVGIGFLGLHKFSASHGAPVSPLAGYGPLVPDPKGIFSLPKGFSYQIISKQGTTMADGLLVPGKGDGMATFPGKNNNTTILIRNHENTPGDNKNGAFGTNNELLSKIDKQKFYDFGSGKLPCTGGTTTLIYNHKTKKVDTEFMSLAGTIRNCAGGPTPWNSWITCEETVEKSNGTLEKDHGYVFEVPATEKPALAAPIPLKAMGRFNHEAVAVEPKSKIVYLTEDDGEGLIYRFIPNSPGKLQHGGKLQALCFQEQSSFDTRNWNQSTLQVNEKFAVHWMDLDDIDSPQNDLRLRGFKSGAARFARGEGMWYGNDEIYFACTNGGSNKTGQVFRYKPSMYEGTTREKEAPGMLELFAEPNDKNILKYCDNLTVAPGGDLILCEDDDHPFLVGITPKGEYYKLGENTGYKSELTGVVFSPDGSTLFVNIQHVGLTLAIEGPWRKGS